MGRGPLAGPVYASAVVIAPADADSFLEGPLVGLTDSKKLTEASRERFCALLRSLPGVRIGIGSASVAEIDSMNILRATHLAMRRAVLDLGDPQPDHILVDGLPVKGLPSPSTAIVKGDAQSLLIAAASVVAKAFAKKNNVYKVVENCFYSVNGTSGTLTRNMTLTYGKTGAVVGVTSSGTELSISADIINQLVKDGVLIKI